MKKADLISYIKATENNVFPPAVAASIQGVSFLSKLPRSLQNLIINNSSKTKTPMSFVVEPYSSFLAFEITDKAEAETLLPPGYSLLASSLFEGGDEKFCAITGAFNVHTSVFWGSRLEFYLVAENQTTGLLSWIIVSYQTNTTSFDPVQGFIGPNTQHCTITSSYTGETIVDVKSKDGSEHISYLADMTKGRERKMNQRLWIEGNLSVDYGGKPQKSTQPFYLIFDPEEVNQGYELPLESVQLQHNTYGASFLAPTPFEAAYFPYAQHFTTTNFPTATTMRTAADIERELEALSKHLPALQ